jgi:anthranilate synthase component 1
MTTPVHYPSPEDFKALAKQANVVPVYRQLLADTLTPVAAFQKFAGGGQSFLLESASGGEKMGRYSFLGSDPFLTFRAREEKVEITDGKRTKKCSAADPIGELERLIGRFKCARLAALPHFACGAVGYAAYDSVRYVERLPNPPKDDLHLPDLYFMFYDLMVVFDHLNKTLKVVCAARLDGKRPDAAYEEARARVDEMVIRLRTPTTILSDDITVSGEPTFRFESNFKRADYFQAVKACKEYIRAGDIFQVVLSQRLKTRTAADPFKIYRALHAINPSPYLFFLKMDDMHLVGSSPEVMVKVENGKVTVRPIAGTRPRGKTDEEDVALARELQADPKERAEHIMLVDLGRNDVGRVSRFGTVKIEEKMIIERFSHVMHMVSTVTGELRSDKTAFDAFRASFPAGTLSGAPKIRAMEILDELEPTRRNHYGGAVGVIDFLGNMNTCITIRTVLLKGEDAYVQAGGGIVADSVPEREYQETLNKAKALFRAIEAAEKL